MRFTTRDLLAAVAFTAILAVFAGQTGFIHPFYWITVAISFALGWIFIRCSNGGMNVTAAVVISAFCALCLGTLATVVVGGLLLLAAIACRIGPPASTRARYYIAMACIACGIGLSMIPGQIEHQRLEKLRREFPIVSLNDRLAYEAKTPLVSPPALQPAVAQQLATVESALEEQGWRRWQLEKIHQRQYDQFARAIGFGPVRMASPRLQSIETPTLRDVPYERQVKTKEDLADDPWRIGQPLGPADAIEYVHESSRSDFLHPEGYGAVISPRNQVAGFIEHAFHRHPLQTANRPKWLLDRIELISLLKFNEPRVYVLDHLPRMDQLSSDTIPTRPLNEFEASALQKLQTDEDLVVAENGNQVQMLGSLRAAKQCLDCHNVQRGELLGAFSYQLTLTGESEASPAADSVAAQEQASP
ncbi:hypothetical protein [Lacipirellula sp.]|uniref:hypothetical protein n=1 Tax=Lacipirellula sp. TaxID=2691419 RepID=UPI003D115D60